MKFSLMAIAMAALLTASCSKENPAAPFTAVQTNTGLKSFMVRGVLKELKPDGKTAVIQHEEIPRYMAAMTMPFRVKDARELANLEAGDAVSFRLLVAAEESWIDQVMKLPKGSVTHLAMAPTAPPAAPEKAGADPSDFTFTNELGQAVSLRDFMGQAVGISFFFTRCPIPEYCPRLSKTFSDACKKLNAKPGGPTNWHLFSVSFDPQFDTPPILKAYAQRYNYDSNHWSFLTGPPERIARLTKMFGLEVEPDGTFFKHDFRTAVIDGKGKVQQIYPFVGDFSDALVEDMIKAAAVKN